MIQDSNPLEWFKLPTAEYNIDTERTTPEVLDLAKAAPSKTWKLYIVFVTKTGGRMWNGLPKLKT